MADEGRPRPVSGEIMTAGDGRTAPRTAPEGALDAEYEVVGPAARPAGDPLAAPILPSAGIGSTEAPLAGLATLRAQPAPPAARRNGGPAFWVAGVGLAAAAFWVSGGHALVRAAAPGAEQPVRALQLSGVRSRVDVSGARPVLFVDGEAANAGSATQTLPPLDIVVTGNDGRITRYKLGTADRPLAPGERFAFSSRLDVPREGVRNVTVSFSQ